MENEELFRILAGKSSVCFELKERLNDMIKREYYPKNQIILRPGQIATHSWFIEKGSAAGYKHVENKEVTLWRCSEGNLMIPVRSFFNQQPADLYIKLLEPSILASISYDHIQEVMKTFPDSNDYIDRIMKDYRQITQYQGPDPDSLTIEERLNNLRPDFRAIFLEASTKGITSYLGISKRTLSQLRNKNKKR